MQQTIAGAFRTVPTGGTGLPVNLEDQAAIVTSPNWTPGATLIDQMAISPPAGQSWTIASYTISFAGAIFSSGIAVRSFGRLGKLLAAIMLGAAPTPAGAITPMRALPTDLSTAVTLWDGSQDPPFGQLTGIGGPATFPNVPIIGGESLAQPIAVGPGEQISLGLWLTPSLIQGVEIYIINAQYTVIYDDGRTVVPNAR
jgi:hypothetical protein